jgi:ubiquitin carboxyl-terminal hydrolase 14
MSRTTDNITPLAFLQVLRQVAILRRLALRVLTYITVPQVNPQFAEMDRREHAHGMMAGYAQQGTCVHF